MKKRRRNRSGSKGGDVYTPTLKKISDECKAYGVATRQNRTILLLREARGRLTLDHDVRQLGLTLYWTGDKWAFYSLELIREALVAGRVMVKDCLRCKGIKHDPAGELMLKCQYCDGTGLWVVRLDEAGAPTIGEKIDRLSPEIGEDGRLYVHDPERDREVYAVGEGGKLIPVEDTGQPTVTLPIPEGGTIDTTRIYCQPRDPHSLPNTAYLDPSLYTVKQDTIIVDDVHGEVRAGEGREHVFGSKKLVAGERQEFEMHESGALVPKRWAKNEGFVTTREQLLACGPKHRLEMPGPFACLFRVVGCGLFSYVFEGTLDEAWAKAVDEIAPHLERGRIVDRLHLAKAHGALSWTPEQLKEAGLPPSVKGEEVDDV